MIEFKLAAEALLGMYDTNGNPVTDNQGNIIIDPVPDWQPAWIKAY